MLLSAIHIKKSAPLKCVLLLAVLAFSQCKNKSADAEKPAVKGENNVVILTDAQLKNAPVTTTQLSDRNIATQLKLNGKIDVPPQSLVSVSVPLGGYLKNTKLLPGMQVKKGEVIAELEDPQYIRLQQDYLQAKSKLHFAQLDYNRQKNLNENQAASDKVMQQAQAEMAGQQIQLNALAQQLRLININPDKLSTATIAKGIRIYSTINGFVSKVNVNIGKYVNPSEVLFELINPDDIHLNLRVYEKDISHLKIGQQVIAYTNNDPGKKIPAEIILISKDIGMDGTADVHCHFHQYDNGLLPGMYMNAVIELQSTFSQALPEESIVDFEGKSYVFAVSGKQKYTMLPVTPGTQENGFVQILNSGELAGKNIVVQNAYTLLMKLKNAAEDE
ncbi:efflux RND transporter periplasmic adaptor subunit [Elizabethkingia anophelis]|jgi:membrane fusion protein, heavy metal efflux system|uniref:Cobalt-zinc-cadmium efflux system membrane fusion protein n=1 Tax=Pedobacter nutrimenti TaxID=1241337 RepID=A0A318UCD3_9SPHI|nr:MULTISPECIES: efflux RND transporter periplasmic adaptor subunit [Bacteroidota]MDV2466335.1 efflux RND transporter periplasmic adaptor subunit [Elizabethkingia anophelis]OJV56423.1 MAG: efflux transporter periplasmic adaptor subunit [Bacteroidetes bacterium 43-16]MDV3725040.1 efflux RND transporter periplasmic adaptor subunit [Elizabethkingia anophelis]MDV3730561.1 efflux RND transporter periplasmic adaptor subunit [Elizabethkingia anophelis]MDV3745445.1 efflux RND transporter periplasmic a